MKSRTNVTIDSKLLKSAKEHNIVLSAVLEKAVKYEIKRKEEELWLKENKDSIENYNKKIKESGTFSDGARTF